VARHRRGRTDRIGVGIRVGRSTGTTTGVVQFLLSTTAAARAMITHHHLPPSPHHCFVIFWFKKKKYLVVFYIGEKLQNIFVAFVVLLVDAISIDETI
jgi:hypothetical protein